MMCKTDPYVEMKSAIKKGKVIQCLQDGSGKWLDIASPNWNAPVRRYRIKPVEGDVWTDGKDGWITTDLLNAAGFSDDNTLAHFIGIDTDDNNWATVDHDPSWTYLGNINEGATHSCTEEEEIKCDMQPSLKHDASKIIIPNDLKLTKEAEMLKIEERTYVNDNNIEDMTNKQLGEILKRAVADVKETEELAKETKSTAIKADAKAERDEIEKLRNLLDSRE